MLYKTLFLFSPNEPIINTLPTSSGAFLTKNDLHKGEPRTLESRGGSVFFYSFNDKISKGEYEYDVSHASDIYICGYQGSENHYGLAICKFGNARTFNPMKNGNQQRKGWFYEPNICKRGRLNITGFSSSPDNYKTSFTIQDLVDFVFDEGFYISNVDKITPTLLLKSKKTRERLWQSMKDGTASAQELVFELENTASLTDTIRPEMSPSHRKHITFDYNKNGWGKSITYDVVVASAIFNLLTGEFNSVLLDTGMYVGYHPRCTWTTATKVFIALKSPETQGKNWRLIVQFATAK